MTLLKCKAIIWKDETLGAEFSYEEIPVELADKSKEYRAMLLDEVVMVDDQLTEKYLNGEDLTEVEIKNCIRKGTVANILYLYYVVVLSKIRECNHY